MNKNTVSLLIISLVTIFFVVALIFLLPQLNQNTTRVSVSTDRQVYYAGDIVHIAIQNLGDRSVDIFCPEFCALGNFPTRVEHLSNGEWQYLVGFCPSIEPLMNYIYDRGYVRHSLSAKTSIDLEISNFENIHLEQDQRLRIVYYLGLFKKPIYSNEFTFNP